MPATRTARAGGAGLGEQLAVLTGRGQGRGWLEVRYRTRTGMRSLFYPAHGSSRRRSLGELIANVSRRTDVYLGCALRAVRAGDKTAIGQIWTLWAECDGPAARQAVEAFAPSPSLLVASGGSRDNRHAYWALDRPVSVEVAEDANRRLAHTLGADPVCYDGTRILRPVGSLNHKHQPARPVTQLAPVRRRPYRLADVTAALPAAPRLSAPVAAASRSARDDRLLEISPRDYVPALTGRPLGRDLKVACPFHDDKTPSLHAYATPERGWYCFGACRCGGSIYDLASGLWQLDTRGPEFVELKFRLRREFL